MGPLGINPMSIIHSQNRLAVASYLDELRLGVPVVEFYLQHRWLDLQRVSGQVLDPEAKFSER